MVANVVKANDSLEDEQETVCKECLDGKFSSLLEDNGGRQGRLDGANGLMTVKRQRGAVCQENPRCQS
jgi:hypothetical protein